MGEPPFAVCFEVEPAAEGLAPYLELARKLRPELDLIAGFESIERSRSVRAETRLLSLSYWANEAAVAAWRSHGAHFEAQVIGREELFTDYRLRVGQVIRRWTQESVSIAAGPEIHHFSEGQVRSHQKRCLLGLLRIEGRPEADRVAVSFRNSSVEFERYESMVTPERTFFVLSLSNEDAGHAVEDQLGREAAATQEPSCLIVFDTCRIVRDYGRFERTEAPQYFPPIARAAV